MIEATPDATNWALFAACQAAFQRGEASPELFFPDRKVAGGRLQEEEAREYCLGCSVADFCLQTALNEKTTYGVEGGLTGPERAKVLQALGHRAFSMVEVAGIRQKYMKPLKPKARVELRRQLAAAQEAKAAQAKNEADTT